MTSRSDILKKADEIINGPRAKVYGSPKQNHDRIAAIWSVILDVEVDAQQAALCMAAVKIARLIQTPDHLDSYVDLAGYAAVTGEMVLEAKASDQETV
jgi:hypothetical protein